MRNRQLLRSNSGCVWELLYYHFVYLFSEYCVEVLQVTMAVRNSIRTSLLNMLRSLETRVPKISVHRIDLIISSLQNSRVSHIYTNNIFNVIYCKLTQKKNVMQNCAWIIFLDNIMPTWRSVLKNTRINVFILVIFIYQWSCTASEAWDHHHP